MILTSKNLRSLIVKVIKEVRSGLERFGGLNPNDPEFKSIETFADWLADNDRTSYTHTELMCLNARTQQVAQTIKDTLKIYGYDLERREFDKPVRGFTANPNAGRFDGMHGGGGGSSITGFAGNPSRGNG